MDLLIGGERATCREGELVKARKRLGYLIVYTLYYLGGNVRSVYLEHENLNQAVRMRPVKLYLLGNKN